MMRTVAVITFTCTTGAGFRERGRRAFFLRPSLPHRVGAATFGSDVWVRVTVETHFWPVCFWIFLIVPSYPFLLQGFLTSLHIRANVSRRELPKQTPLGWVLHGWSWDLLHWVSGRPHQGLCCLVDWRENTGISINNASIYLHKLWPCRSTLCFLLSVKAAH